MNLLRVLSAEILKLKGTIALRMVVIAPIAVVSLLIFLTANVSSIVLNQRTEMWMALTRVMLTLWAILMLPLYITLQTALVAGVDHSDNHWKILLARPVPRWAFYLVKLSVNTALTAISTLLLASGIIVAGLVLPFVQPEFHFGSPIPWLEIFQKATEVGGLAFLLLTIQHWASLRWRSFTTPMAVGTVGLVVGYVMLLTAGPGDPGWAIYCPWSLPMMALAPSVNVKPLLLASGSLGIVVSAIGCWELSRRDV